MGLDRAECLFSLRITKAEHNGSPYVTTGQREDLLLSYAFEANSFSPNETPSFRIRLGGGIPSDFRIFDPVLCCRWGGLPR